MLRRLNKEITRAKMEANNADETVYGALCGGRALAYTDCKDMLESKIHIIETFCISTNSSDYEDGFFDCVRQVVKLLKGESE